MAEAYLGLGSNLGDRRSQLRAALVALDERGVRIRQVSSLYETDPMYETAQPRFLNAVASVETELTPEALLAAAKDVERQLGRKPRARFGPREIDVDILLYADERRLSSELTIPHARMGERPFVQAPLAEVRGQPDTGRAGMTILEGPEWADG